ncbi:MAG: Lrp/AsnC ligand binding domain-containing protein [Ardenticatenia bacterium]|nr:Lrp/AsnC ligand binding domain-containing protein [Ardenticatenia bacterium]
MVTAVVLINVERARVNDVAQVLVDLDGVTEVFSVAGRWDLVAILRVPSNEAMADLVTGAIQAVPGITTTETLLAFKTFSHHDLERLFSIGFDE